MKNKFKYAIALVGLIIFVFVFKSRKVLVERSEVSQSAPAAINEISISPKDSMQALTDNGVKDEAKSQVVAMPVASESEADKKWTAEEMKEIKRRRDNAKFALASTFTAMMSFKAEFDRYSTDLKSLGFSPMQSEMNYKLGFVHQFRPSGSDNNGTNEDWNSEINLTTDTFVGEVEPQSSQKYKYTPESEKIDMKDYAKYCVRGCTSSEGEFEILLVLPLPNSSRVDVWTVNERKEITQVLDGTAVR